MIEYDFEGHVKSQIDRTLSYMEGFTKAREAWRKTRPCLLYTSDAADE